MRYSRSICVGILGLACVVWFQPSLAQQKPGNPQAPEDVIRINTELVETAVSVFDKQGRFVDGLKKEDFELRIAGRLVPVSSFENIVSGSQRDRVVRSQSKTSSPAASTERSERQRTIVFFVDDRHLSLDSVVRTRKTLLEFVNDEMGQNDLVAIASASGQIGFLQQFTDNKDVLREAVNRINHVPYSVSDYGKNPGTPMTEYMALTIERKDDPNVFEFFVQDCQNWAPKGASRTERFSMRRHCEIEVQNRARQILLQAGTVTSGTYLSLQTLLQSAERMPGSKLAFFVSDGFLADTGARSGIARNQIQQIADKARRAGVVIYTIDARGLTSGALDATGNVPVDPNGRLESANMRHIAASQEALDGLASDTGGRALHNQNQFNQFITDALAETSRYYLISWRPEANEITDKSIRKIEVSITGRHELLVRSARAFVPNVARAGESTSQTESKPSGELKDALADFYPRHDLPVELSLMYIDTPRDGLVLTSSVQVPGELLSYGDGDKQPAELSIAGVVLNDRGKPSASFTNGLKVNSPALGRVGEKRSSVIYNHRSQLKAGIYQVRVVARDNRSGILGSAMQWIVVPDLSTGQLSLSSLILGVESVINKGGGGETVQWSVDKKFALNSHVGFMTFIYNGTKRTSNHLLIQAQVYRDGRAVVSTPSRQIVGETQEDPNRIPFHDEINLRDLRPGRYVLEVIVENRDTHAKASQQSIFYIE